MGWKDKISFHKHLDGFPDGVTSGQQYHVGEKLTVILYTYIINRRHAGCCFSHSACCSSGCQPEKTKKLLYTVANPARGLLNREKRTKEKVWQHTPPPTPHTARSEKINKITLYTVANPARGLPTGKRDQKRNKSVWQRTSRAPPTLLVVY